MSLKSGTDAGAATAAMPAGTMSSPSVVTPANMIDLLTRCQPGNRLSAQGAEYVNTLTNELRSSGIEVKIVPMIEFDVVCVYSVAERTSILLIMQETVQNAAIPAPDRCPEIIPKVCASLGVEKAACSIVVTPEDYPLVRNMVTKMQQYLHPQLREFIRTLNVSAFQKCQLSVDTDVEAVKAFVKSRSPHAVMERIDCGFIVRVRVTNTAQTVTVSDLRRVDEMTLFAVGAYTDIIEDNRGATPKFLPIVTINSIVTDCPTPGILSVVLPFAADILVHHNGWLAPYGFGPGSIKLGALFSKEDGAPLEITSPAQRDQIMRQYFTEPYLAINITDGRDRIPGIDLIAASGAGNTVVEDLKRFFGAVVPGTDGVSPMIMQWVDYVGDVNTGNMIRDSREFDFLNLVSMGVPASNALPLLFKVMDPRARLAAVSEHVKGVRPLYINRHVVLDGQLVVAIAMCLSRAGLNIQYLNAGPMMDSGIQPLLAHGSGLQSVSLTASPWAGMNPAGVFYGSLR